MRHTILGAGGPIGQNLATHLAAQSFKIRQVSRNPKKANDTDETVSADLLVAADVDRAVAGSDVAYLVAGLPYNTKVWREQWPKVMRNTIDACKKHATKLVFFDNVYAYGLVSGPMSETTPFNPTSNKGEVRAKIATMLLDEMRSNNLQAMIVRSADFYGRGALLSATHSTVTDRLAKGKNPQWMGDPSKLHSFTYTPDAAKTVALLAQKPEAFGQTWHALTSAEPITGNDYVRLAFESLGQPTKKIQSMSRNMMRMIGIFVPVLRELSEMLYQFENDYVFDSSKAKKALSIVATPYREGIAASLK